ncbi:MAG: 2-oxoacid:acceptor oxidoreductase family protein [Planctomycetota bacterium]|nr:2-oxoacid:acceptor oxidoreductase family protein [Planctomycetota bacterium]
MNIYLCGVGGQGIGLLSEVMFRACNYASYKVHGCDTHGLAQRGGSVVSNLRIGDRVFTPLISEGQADLIVALEMLEGYRAASKMLKEGGTLLYYDARYQPIDVRMKKNEYVTEEQIRRLVESRNGSLVRLKRLNSRLLMQNVVLLGNIVKLGLVERLEKEHVSRALEEMLPSNVRELNMKVFNSHCA